MCVCFSAILIDAVHFRFVLIQLTPRNCDDPPRFLFFFGTASFPCADADAEAAAASTFDLDLDLDLDVDVDFGFVFGFGFGFRVGFGFGFGFTT